MSGQMAEKIPPQIPGNSHESVVAYPTGNPPQQVVGGNQSPEHDKGGPNVRGYSARKRVHEKFYAVLGAHRASDRTQHCSQDNRVRNRPPPHVAEDEREGTLGVVTQIGHARLNSPWMDAAGFRSPVSITTRATQNLSTQLAKFPWCKNW